ncbi:eukaryotic phosphomannomutase [Kockovaella imperatae]|uniref:Phosphomannomutase n=1 Tax=Kockovaella imperatae TaxID=4999 RepID=A0A1Y1UCQ4_9TREE|nr:eukaryotic phosphomannomutase [Kockovaella imperatae]ORX35317.1 eukaryotic phosphomannomutase [Kockovaella imperatae]
MANVADNEFPSGVTPFSKRTQPRVLCMFDVDGTLSRSRRNATPEMFATLKALKEYCAVAVVSGSNVPKTEEQLHIPGQTVQDTFDYVLGENGLTPFKFGKSLPTNSFIQHVGEDEYKKMVSWIMRYLADLDIPIKRGTFIEFRKGMINVSPIGRNCSNEERDQFEIYDNEHHIRKNMLTAMRKEFEHLGLTYSIGGQISFDVFPHGWDKTYALKHVENEGFDEIHFFGDKTMEGGNDHEIYEDPRTIGHTVKNPEETIVLLNKLFLKKE